MEHLGASACPDLTFTRVGPTAASPSRRRSAARELVRRTVRLDAHLGLTSGLHAVAIPPLVVPSVALSRASAQGSMKPRARSPGPAQGAAPTCRLLCASPTPHDARRGEGVTAIRP